jgi:hypothetical protein
VQKKKRSSVAVAVKKPAPEALPEEEETTEAPPVQKKKRSSVAVAVKKPVPEVLPEEEEETTRAPPVQNKKKPVTKRSSVAAEPAKESQICTSRTHLGIPCKSKSVNGTNVCKKHTKSPAKKATGDIQVNQLPKDEAEWFEESYFPSNVAQPPPRDEFYYLDDEIEDDFVDSDKEGIDEYDRYVLNE